MHIVRMQSNIAHVSGLKIEPFVSLLAALGSIICRVAVTSGTVDCPLSITACEKSFIRFAGINCCSSLVVLASALTPSSRSLPNCA